MSTSNWLTNLIIGLIKSTTRLKHRTDQELGVLTQLSSPGLRRLHLLRRSLLAVPGLDVLNRAEDLRKDPRSHVSRLHGHHSRTEEGRRKAIENGVLGNSDLEIRPGKCNHLTIYPPPSTQALFISSVITSVLAPVPFGILRILQPMAMWRLPR